MGSEMDERTLTISGVKVIFPCKPYPSQFSMMDRVIKGLERQQNSLLESPTGSGKSLALLCSALAWQNSQHERLAREGIAADQGGTCKPCECSCNKNPAPATKIEYSPESKPKSMMDTTVIPESDEEDEDDDFKSSVKYRTPKSASNKKREHVKIEYEDSKTELDPPTKCTCKTEAATPSGKQKVPTIYFGTRTHKQIAQITREMGKTAYHDARMTILASREYTCVHPEVSKMKSKSEGCRDRLDIHGPGCKFNDRAKRTFLSQAHLQVELPSAWDLEDFVGACEKKKACPYFVTRNIKDRADIIFCPYNYLIDPIVRKSMEINLKDQVVILDEAHNIEDCARDAASGSLTTDQITQALHNIQEMLHVNVKFSEHLKMSRMLDSLLQFIEENRNNLDQADYDTSYRVWSGFDIVARLKSIGLGPESFQEYKASLESVGTSAEDQTVIRNRRNQEVKLKTVTLNTLELIVQLLDYMYRDDLRFVEDYRVAIMRSMQFVPYKKTNDAWMGKNRRGGSKMEVFTINFWCMNPAVAFSDFTPCRNIVLSSGTLSPMSSFSSELGVDFPIQLEANHVIQDKQVMVGSLGSGPGGNPLQAVFRNMETFTFQDELGSLILQVCKNVPHGVLCFLPSYRSLEKFTERWKLTGLWRKMASRKRVLVEPRRGDREDFDNMMKAFYEVVKGDTTSNYLNEVDHCEDDSEIDGALFLAVCRGKVSEGMDFADNNARAVITVGIPFPSIKDLQVKLKREYNDRHRSDRGLLSGNDWYEIQAFRALNQALGRCIRHRKDWGALIIVDDRFVKNSKKYCKGLSKWVRNKVQTFNNFAHFLEELTNFNETMCKEMPVISPNTSFIPRTPSTNRRDSVYQKDMMETTLVSTPRPSPDLVKSPLTSPMFPGTGVMHSPYFSPQASQTNPLARKLLQTAGQPATKSPEGNDSLQTVHISAEVASLPWEQQLKQVISSGAVPKDQSYYLVLNKGRPDEQMFFIEPNKKGSLKSMEASKPAESSVNPPGGPYPTIVVKQEPVQLPVALTSPPPQPKWKTYIAAGGMGLSAQDQLKQVMASPLVPKHEPCFVVVNDGHPDRQTFLIQPPDATSLDSNCTNTLPVNPAPSVDPQNKFLKFCQLPKTPAPSVPVATVTPQRNTSIQEKLQGTATSNQNNEANAATAEHSHLNQTSVVSEEMKEASTVLNEDNVKTDPEAKRKRLFKKKDTKVEDTVPAKNGQESIASADVKIECVEIKKENIVKSEVKEELSEVSGPKSVKAEISGQMPPAVAEKLKQMKRMSEEMKEERTVNDVLSDVKTEFNVKTSEQALVNLENSEEDDFLVTRRRSGRKRKTSSRLVGTKRIKGIQYDEDEKEDVKENLVSKKNCVKCAACGSVLIQQTDCERQRRHPAFLDQWCPKATELLHFSMSEVTGSSLVPLSVDTGIPGVQLDSCYDDKTGTSVQYLQCKGCVSRGTSSKANSTVVGARVVLTRQGSSVQPGQTWILASAVCT